MNGMRSMMIAQAAFAATLRSPRRKTSITARTHMMRKRMTAAMIRIRMSTSEPNLICPADVILAG